MTETSLPTPTKEVDAVLSYVPIVPVFIWTMMKHGDNSSYVWHAKNAAGILALDVAVVLALKILIVLMPLSLVASLGLLSWLLYILLAAVSAYALWETWNGKQAVIPYVTNFGQNIPLEKWFHPKAMSTPISEPMATPAPMVAPIPEPTPTPVVEPAPMPMPAPTTPEAPMAPEAPKPAEPTPPTPTV